MPKGPTFQIRYTSPKNGGSKAARSSHRWLQRLREEAEVAARGRVWWYYAPLLLPLGWILFQHLGAENYSSIFGGLNLATHEAGHLLFMWSRNDFLTVAGGTLFQCLCPVFTAVMFYRQRDFFAITVALFWLGTNFVHIAPYAADARAQLLPLVSPFPGAPGHDWNYLLGTVGLLRQDQKVGAVFRGAGLVTMSVALILAVQQLRLVAAVSRQGGGPSTEASRLSDHLEKTDDL